MGIVIETSVDRIRLTQVVLVRNKFEEPLRLYNEGNFEDLLPSTSRRIGENEYALINGLHRLMISACAGLNSRLYVAENQGDDLTSELFPKIPLGYINQSNKVLKKVFNEVPNLLKLYEKIRNIQNLQDEYGLHTIVDLSAFVEGKITHPWALDDIGDYSFTKAQFICNSLRNR